MRVVIFALALMAPSALGCSSGGATGSPPDGGDASAGDAPLDSYVSPVDGGAPFLIELAVSSSASSHGSASVSLVPPFSSTIFDYYVRCQSGSNPLTISMTASLGSKSSLLRPTASPALPKQTLSLEVSENQAIVAAAINQAGMTEYWVRCLPANFPELRMTVHAEAGIPPPGYYLVGDFLPTTQGAYAMVLDGNGVPVWYFLGAGQGMGDVEDVIPGAISFIPFDTPMAKFQIQRLDPPSTTYAAPSATLLDGHELRVAPTGEYVVISNPVANGFDLTGITVSLPDGGTQAFGPNSSIQDCVVVEFEPKAGTVAWTWTGSEHLDPVKDSTLPALGTFGVTGPDGGLVVDPFHCNSVDVDPANGNLLVSARNMDSVFYVDRTSGAILWKMGGSAYTKDDATYVTVGDTFYRQHDARMQPGWSASCAGGTGQISMFDDESQRSAPARGVVYDVVVGSADGGQGGCEGGAPSGAVPGTAVVVWQRKGTTNSSGVGSFRISLDGSRVIGWGFGAPNLVFTEVDLNGSDLLDFEFTDGNSSYRAVKVSLTALDLNAMRNTAGIP
jgi:Arylsulfotransferase (ASST)